MYDASRVMTHDMSTYAAAVMRIVHTMTPSGLMKGNNICYQLMPGEHSLRVDAERREAMVSVKMCFVRA